MKRNYTPLFSISVLLLLWTSWKTTQHSTVDLLDQHVVEVIMGVAGPVTNITQNTMHATIQEAVNMAVANDVIEASDGGYAENVIINKALTLRSQNGRGSTTIGGSDNGTLGTILIQDGTNDVVIGTPGQGFTIIGFDNDNGAVEAAAVYLDGAHTNITIQDNDVRANGEAGLLSEFNAAINNIVIDNNIFSGQTFAGLNPGGVGFSTQFDPINNVPRQLVVMGGGDGVTNSMNVTFTNNKITGVAGGISSDDFISEQGNTLVTIDVIGATITDNNFMGTTTRFGSSLRVRGQETVVKDNIFSGANLGVNNSHIFFGNTAPLGFANAIDPDVDDLEGVMLNNTFDVAAGVFNSITPNYVGAILAGPTDQEVLLLPDTYTFDAQVVIDENRTIRGLGTDKTQTILQINFNTGASGDPRGWFLVNEGFEFGLENLTMSGDGFLVFQAVRHKGFGTFDNVQFTEIKYNESGPNYGGTAIAAFGTTSGQANVDVTNSMFNEIGRVGVLFFGSTLDASSFTDNMYTGKGTGDFLDYAADISAGAVVTVTGNAISGNRGTASSDGSGSAGILASTFFGAGTTATISDNIITDNSLGVAVGFNSSDASNVTINNNNIFDNDFGVSSTNPTVDATPNWWGDASGPSGEGLGTGDAVSENVLFCPWLTAPKDDPMVGTDGFVTNTSDMSTYCTIQDAVDAATAGDVIEISARTYEERVNIDKSLTLQGATNDKSLYILDGTNLAVGGSGINIVANVTDVTITNLTIQNYTCNNTATQAGIAAQGSNDNLTVQNVKVDNNLGGRAGLYANGPIDNVLFDQVMAVNHNSPGFQRGIVIWNNHKSNITISNCMASNNACCGIELQDGTASGVNIINNTVTDNADNGIGLTTLNGLTGANVISGNTVTDCGRFGIEIKNPEGTGLDSGVGSIVVENNNVSFTASPAMNIRDHAGIAVFRRSLLSGNPDNYPDVPTGVIVRNNMVSGYTQLNPSATTSEGFGIVIEGTNHTVSGNTIEDNDIGLQLQGGGHPNANYVMNNSGDGTQNDGASPNYFGRGNAPVLCEVTVDGTNTFTNNGTDKRLVTDDVLLTDMMDIVAAAKGSVSRSGDGSVTYCTIQDAIDAASAGETVTAAASLYVEDVTINKAITLEGPNEGISPCDGTRVEAAEKRGYINITADGVTIDGMDFVDGKQIPLGEKTAIQIVGGIMNTTIQNSSFIRNDGTPDPGFDTFRGIINEIGGTTNLEIDENSFSGWHTGIYLQNADETDVTNNCINNNMVGISSDNPIDVDINNNEVTNNQFEGIGVGDNGSAVSIEINNNNIVGNLTGVSNYSNDGLIVDAESNWWGDAAGPNENNTAMPGNGDIVNEMPGEIDFCPWLDDEVGTGVLVPGPMAVTRDIVIALDASGNAAITASQIDNGSTNGCDEPPTTLVLDITTFDCDDEGDNTVTLTITDEFGRMDTETAIVTIVDNAAPLEIECPDDIMADNDAGLCTAVVNFDLPEAYDIAYFESFEAGFVANTYSSFVEFNSTINTVASGTDGITSTDGTMHAILNSTAVPPSSSTGAFTRMNGYTTEFGEGYRVSLDVYMDLDDPAVTADTYGWDLTSAASRQDGSHLRDFIFHTASNAAGNILVGGSNNTNFTRRNDLASINNYEIISKGWYTFEWIFRDDAGVLAVDLNLLDASGVVLFTETRSTPADDIATTVGGNRYSWFTFLEVDELAIDNMTLGRNLAVTCDATSGFAFPAGTTTVTCMATDACGNEVDCSFDITVTDAENPVVICPAADVEVNTDVGTCEAVVDLEALVSVMDNCDTDVDLTFVPASGSAFVLGSTQVMVTATDDAGNMANCMFNVVVSDMEMPSIACPGNVTIDADASCEATLGNFTPLAVISDNCSINDNITVTQDPVAGSTLSLGDNTITLFAMDESSNVGMCTFIITVEDNTDPTISCPSALMLTADANCSQATLPDYTGLATTSDNCVSVTVTQMPVAGSMLNIGANTVTLTATDGAGNTSTCDITVTVVDDSDPVFTSCAPDVTATYDAECEATLADYTGDAVAEDNCNVTITQDPMPSTPLVVGETMVTLTATDDAGNTATCMFTVTLPVINTLNIKVFLEGAYNSGTGMMRTDLNDKRLLPGQQPSGFFSTSTPVGQPYDMAPWNYMGDEGNDFDFSTVGNADAGYDSDVVDWVLVSLRSGTAANTTLCQQAGLLYEDGTIQFPSGCNCTVEEGEMVYVVVEHRNHLAVMSDMQVTVGVGGTVGYDFTTQNSFTTVFSSGQKEISSGVFVMYGGNGDQTMSRTDINNSDLAPYISSNGDFNIYTIGDYSMNADVNLVDEIIFATNNGTFSGIDF